MHRVVRRILFVAALALGAHPVMAAAGGITNTPVPFGLGTGAVSDASTSVNVTAQDASSAFAPIFDGVFTATQPFSATEYPRQSFIPGHVTAVPDPGGSGVAVAKYAISNSDQPYPGSHPRGDMLTGNWYKQGTVLYTSIPVLIPTGLPLFQGNAQSFFQWVEAKDTAASAPSWGMGLKAMAGTNRYYLGVTGGNGYTTSNGGDAWNGPPVDGNWHTATIEALYTSSSTGWLKMWWDGNPVTFNSGPASGTTEITGIRTITDGAAAWPLDIDNYRSSGTVPWTVTVYHGSPKIGTTMASVAPAAGPAGP